jgi:hypothetical protein
MQHVDVWYLKRTCSEYPGAVLSSVSMFTPQWTHSFAQDKVPREDEKLVSPKAKVKAKTDVSQKLVIR